ncbi:coiled-coil domain-containing protein 22 [Tetranychus urticae]|uniref:Coiled-coil domain-containing protein 22 homolog n=1 Tax=Tetranychus urticae TaxID=32264 RepID=T1KGV1_TETUR|nr:coiled-coil domain-containing protein 22 [Tetranychus urticae]
MEEVDSIIIHQLKQIHSDFNEEYTSLRQLDYNTIMKCLIECISLVDKNLVSGLNVAPQSNMASKYKLCTSLAEICVELGFKGDLGYQTFLYCNDSDLRRLFLFLLEKIPKDDSQDMTTINITGDTIYEKICKKPISTVWLPPVIPSKSQASTKLVWKTQPINGILNASSISGNRIAPDKRNYYDNYAKIPLHDVASLLEWNSASLDTTYTRLTSSKKRMIENVEFVGQKIVTTNNLTRETSDDNFVVSSEVQANDEGDDDEAKELELKEIMEKEISSLEEAIEETKQRLSECEQIFHQQNQSMKEAKESLKIETDKLISMKTSDRTMTNLANDVEHVKAELSSFQDQWKTISGKLVDKINAIKEDKLLASQNRNFMVQEIHKMKKESRVKLKELNEKDGLIKQLRDKSKKPLPPNRASYTQRIMELVNNVKKQNEETKKILLETRQLQKDINIVTGKVQRAYTITDETVFRDAKNSDWNRKCYKLLATMHKNYDALLDCVNAIGTIRRETLQLEETIENEKHNESIVNLDRIQQDLKQLQTENHLIMNQNGTNGQLN